ncbi:transportin-3-like [Saccoglossus kowalevskii]|uniref:Transportin-3-like n=1 Tax=Saccoglossus kowalevskii TaxID=10224 RepID=A0ABM0N1D4_SACKO|nr:PREDICTED: transportin-3-like [Saccoglossus kowalevskii]
MEGSPNLETVIQAVQTLYHSPDVSAKEKASQWLGELQRSVHAWQIADQLLRYKQDVESSYFAAHTMRTKIQYSFHELPANSHTSLRDSLLSHIETLPQDTSQVILTQLCLALADLALQMVVWKKAPVDMIQRQVAAISRLPLTQDLPKYYMLAHTLFDSVMQLPEAYHLSVAEEDIDKSINFCRIFTELAESFLECIIKMPGQGIGSLASLDLLLTCVGHHQYEVAEICFNFWYRLSETLYKDNNEEINDLFRPYIQRLINALSIHCQMDSDHEGIPDEKDDFGDFRLRVAELIKDVVFLVGSSTCFKQMFEALSAQGVNTSWNVTEAALFVMAAVAKNVLPQESEAVPQVVEAIINLPKDAHIAVRYTSTQLVGELGEWIEEHTQYLDPILAFLMQSLQTPCLASVSANSIQCICNILRDQMAGHFDGLLQITKAVDSFNLSDDAAIGLIKGTSIILAKLPSELVTDGVRQLVMVQIQPLGQLVKADAPKLSHNNDPAIWLDRLAAIFRYASPTVKNGQPHPCQPVFLEVWPVLSEVLNKYKSDDRIIERCCRCLRFAVRNVGKWSAVLLTPLVTQMVNVYQQHHHSCFLYLGSILVDEYGDDQSCTQGLLDMLQAFCIPTFLLLQQNNGFRDHPDTVDDLFRLATRFLQRCTIAFLQFSILSALLECGLAAISLEHRDANASVMKFFRDLIYSSTGNESVCRWLEAALKALPTETTTGAVTATHKQLTEFHKQVTSAEDQKKVSYALRDFARLYR